MGNAIREVQIIHADLPLKMEFRHATKARSLSESIFIKIRLEDGIIGYGEALPREYVTGETVESVKESLKAVIKRAVLGYSPEDYGKIPAFMATLDVKGNAARCAIETAVIDTFGRHFGLSVGSLINNKDYNPVRYSGVAGATSVSGTVKACLGFRIFGLRYAKIKVGLGDDISRLRAARRVLGRSVNIRVDANCAWGPEEAVERIGRMRRFGISAVEQPVRADDIDGLMMVTSSVPEDIIADESVCSIDDASLLASKKACNTFNIRISKCGGIMNSLEIGRIAIANDIGIQLGCQVGESGLLSAAGWHFARAFENIPFCEGAYGRFLLKEDIVKEDVTIRPGGTVRPITGHGLGVNVVEKKLKKYMISTDILN